MAADRARSLENAGGFLLNNNDESSDNVYICVTPAQNGGESTRTQSKGDG